MVRLKQLPGRQFLVLKVLAAITFAVQLVFVPWRHDVVMADFYYANLITLSYRPVWSPPSAHTQPEIAMGRLALQLTVTAMLVWSIARLVKARSKTSSATPD